MMSSLRTAFFLTFAFAAGFAYCLLSLGYNPHYVADPMHGRERVRIVRAEVQTMTAPDGAKHEIRAEITQDIEQYPQPPDRFSRAMGYTE